MQKSESTVQKMQKDNQKLQTEIISQNQNYDTLKIKLESLQDKNLELDERLRYTLFYKWFTKTNYDFYCTYLKSLTYDRINLYVIVLNISQF